MAPASSGSSACGNTPACNDNYVDSLELNHLPQTKLNRTSTLADTEDTSTASVQSNLFNPCVPHAAPSPNCPQGPPENTSCNGTGFGRTIWYDFYPDTGGTVLIGTSALFQNVITLYTFDNNSRSASFLVPVKKKCVVSQLGGNQLVASVKKGVAYTFAIGGTDTAQAPTGAGGQVRMTFDYYPTPPRRLSANATLTAKATSNGIQLVSLNVSTARAAKVAVDCGGFCRPASKSKNATEQFRSLRGTSMPAGSALTIRVTAPHSIGVLIRYKIARGNFTKQTFCTEPGSRKPRTKCH